MGGGGRASPHADGQLATARGRSIVVGRSVHVLKVIVQDRRAEQQTVEPVEHAAVAGEERPRVLDARPPLEEALVEIAVSVPGVIGSRMTGGGFGGCTITLAQHDAVEALRRTVERDYPSRTGCTPRIWTVSARAGAGYLAT